MITTVQKPKLTQVQSSTQKIHPESKKNSLFKAISMHEVKFKCLNGKGIFDAKISDHLPVIHEGTLFWNVMMQCRFNSRGNFFNNGFGIVESE